jgi:hypothetical protein
MLGEVGDRDVPDFRRALSIIVSRQRPEPIDVRDQAMCLSDCGRQIAASTNDATATFQECKPPVAARESDDEDSSICRTSVEPLSDGAGNLRRDSQLVP